MSGPLPGAAPTEGGRAATLLVRCEAALAASCRAPLLAAMTGGTVDASAFGRYLVVEHEFVRTAARVAGWCVWAEPDWPSVVRHAEAVADLVGAQEAHLAGLRRAWPVDPKDLPALRLRAAPLADTLLAALDTGGHPAVVTCLAAAETLYLRWCTAAAQMLRPRPAAVQEWIDAHTTPTFQERVGFLHSLVDAVPAEVPDAQLDAWFTDLLAAEDAFHAAPVAT